MAVDGSPKPCSQGSNPWGDAKIWKRGRARFKVPDLKSDECESVP